MQSWLTWAGVATMVFVNAGGALAQTRAAAAKPAATDKTWSLLRTPWGDPDLQEIWSTEDLRDIPYERPDEFAGRASLSEEEFAARRAQAERAASRAQSGFANASKTRTFRQTSLIADGDGKYPRLTPNALQRFRITDIGTYGEGPFLGPEDFNLYDRCITRGVVGSLLPVAYGNGLQIFQTPSAVVINYEMVHETRVIPLDGRPHVGSRINMYMGDSKGQIDYQVLVNDPATWTRPFTMAFPLTTHQGYQLFPYECHEGNLMIVQALSGARADDRAEADAVKSGRPPKPRTPVWEAPEGVQVPR